MRSFISISQGRRVVCQATIDLPMSASRAWGQIRDFHRFAAHDYFHRGIAIAGGMPRERAALRIEHRFGPFRTQRVGRIARWREGSGFAFSDLSLVDGRRGLPHVFSIDRAAAGETSCRVTVRVRGRWTARTPRWVGRLWLAWVFLPIAQRVRNDLMMYLMTRAGKIIAR